MVHFNVTAVKRDSISGKQCFLFGDQFIFAGCQNRDFEKSRAFINYSFSSSY